MHWCVQGHLFYAFYYFQDMARLGQFHIMIFICKQRCGVSFRTLE